MCRLYVGQAEVMLIKDENESKAYVDALAAARYRMLRPYLLFSGVITTDTCNAFRQAQLRIERTGFSVLR